MKIKSLFWLAVVGLVAGTCLWLQRGGAPKDIRSATATESPVTGKTVATHPLAKPAMPPVPAKAPEPHRASPAAPAEPSNISSHAATIANTRASYQERSAAIKTIGKSTGKSDREALYHFLTTGNEEDGGEVGRLLKNELMDQFAMNEAEGFAPVLAEVYHDNSQDLVLRDYALQHLIEVCQYDLEQGKASKEQLNQLKRTLWQAVKETDSSIGGTALLGLSRLSDVHSEFDRTEVVQVAVRYAADENLGELTRVTALQVCARMNAAQALPVLLKTAETGQTLPLRLSAIGALGAYPEPEVKTYLTRIMAGKDGPLKTAAKQALNRIRTTEKQGNHRS